MHPHALMSRARRFLAARAMRMLIRLRRFPDGYKIGLSLGLWGLSSVLLLRVPLTSGPIESAPHAIYAALQLASLNAAGVPVFSDPSPLGQAAAVALWGCYFLVPGTVLAALTELVFRAFSKPLTLTRACDGHTVVLGVGGHGRVVLEEALKRAAHPWDVVTIDRASQRHGLDDNDAGQSWVSIRGDILDRDNLRDAAIDRAERVFVCTGNPAVNIMAAERVALLNPSLAERIVVLADDAEAVNLILPHRSWQLFQQYEHAASALWQDLWEHWQNTAEDPGSAVSISILGVGRFGRALMHQLPAELPVDVQVERLTLVDTRPVHLEPGQRATLAEALAWDDAAPGLQTVQCDALGYISTLVEGPAEALRRHLLVLAMDSDITAMRCLEWVQCGRTADRAPVFVTLRLAEAASGSDVSAQGVRVFPMLPAFRERLGVLLEP